MDEHYSFQHRQGFGERMSLLHSLSYACFETAKRWGPMKKNGEMINLNAADDDKGDRGREAAGDSGRQSLCRTHSNKSNFSFHFVSRLPFRVGAVLSGAERRKLKS